MNVTKAIGEIPSPNEIDEKFGLLLMNPAKQHRGGRGKIANMLGLRFNRLVVKSKAENTKPVKWLCQCDCGVEVIVRGEYLRSGHTKSCGCIRIGMLYVNKKPSLRQQLAHAKERIKKLEASRLWLAKRCAATDKSRSPQFYIEWAEHFAFIRRYSTVAKLD